MGFHKFETVSNGNFIADKTIVSIAILSITKHSIKKTLFYMLFMFNSIVDFI